MAYKSLLTFHALDAPIDMLEPMIEIARAGDAHLDVIVLGVLISPPITMYDVAPATEWVAHNNEIMKRALDRVNEIEKYVAEQAISATVTAECDYLGKLEKIAARYALCTDISLVKTKSINALDGIGSAFNGILFDAKHPILLLPEPVPDLQNISKILIAWNGRTEASQAVHSALPLLKNADAVHIAVIDPQESDVGGDPGSDLAAYLSRYGIDITIDILASGGMSVAEKLLQRARDVDADILVMGGYGHSKVREWLLGGTTVDILNSANVPVLMSH